MPGSQALRCCLNYSDLPGHWYFSSPQVMLMSSAAGTTARGFYAQVAVTNSGTEYTLICSILGGPQVSTPFGSVR